MIEQSIPSTTVPAEPRRWLLLGTGYACFATGFVGMFLPVLPTTVFWIVAAICFARSSPAMYRRILAWPGVGPAIGDFLDRGIVRPRSKKISLAGMAFAAALLVVLASAGLNVGVASGALLLIAGAAVYVKTRPGS